MRTLATGACVLGLLCASTAAWAAEPRLLPGARPALSLDLAGADPSETFAVEPALVAGLAATAFEGTVRVADWPVAPGERRAVELTRHDVYASGARVVVVGPGGEREVPRSRLAFFWGTAVGDLAYRALVALDPDSGRLGGLGVTPEGVFEIQPAPARAGEYRVARADATLAAAAAAGEPGEGGFTCGGSPTHPEDQLPFTTAAGGATTSAISSIHTVTMAVDTDNELLNLKFANNTTNATNYIAQLIAGMNAIYERDLFVRLVLGHTILRPSTAADPWSQPSCPAWPTTCANTGGASGAQLDEFTLYWRNNYGAVTRGLAMMLSGKQSSGSSASGIAWVNALCNGQYGYSFSQVFKFSGSTAANDVKLVGHEIGHNFGSRHTHCPTATHPTPIDSCYSGESGCYDGTPSCPSPFTIDPVNGGPISNVTGTLMSYCHLLSGCSASPVFHPETVNVIAPLVQSKVGVCVQPTTAPPANVRGTKTVAGTFTPGGSVSYTIVLSNTGTGAQPNASGDELTDVLPSSLTLVSASAGSGTAVATTGTNTVTWNGTIAAGGSVTITIQATVKPGTANGTVVSNQGTIRYDGDGNGSNEATVSTDDPGKPGASDATTFTVVVPANPFVRGTKTVSGRRVPGGAIGYTIVLTNSGQATQPDVGGSDELTDVLPSSLTLVSASAGSGSAVATLATNTVTWNGSVPAGGSVTVTIQATVKSTTAAGAVVSNQGTIRYDADGNGSNEATAPTDDPAKGGASDATTFTVGLGFYTLSPCRLVDTRTTHAPALGASQSRAFTAVGGACGVPADAKSLSLNVTVVPRTAPGNVVVYPGNLPAPSTSTVNFVPGVNRANFALVGLATNGAGTFAVKNNSTAAVDLVVDVAGYFR